jgi:Lhr-like helicase
MRYPALARWFDQQFPALRKFSQRRCAIRWPLAPTGSGKTLASFLSVLSELAWRAEANDLPNAVCAVYTTPQILSSILSQSGCRSGGFRVRMVIVDEIHSFAEGKRGAPRVSF